MSALLSEVLKRRPKPGYEQPKEDHCPKPDGDVHLAPHPRWILRSIPGLALFVALLSDGLDHRPKPGNEKPQNQ
jgi:hypothetical protein